MNTTTECTKSELDLFTVPPTQTSIEEGKWDIIYPESGYDKNNSILFRIPSTDSHYLDLSETQLFIELKLAKNQAHVNAENVGPVNNLMHSMFSQIKIRLNDKDVENSNNYYHYKSYFENLLSYGTDAKRTFLENEGWLEDTPKNFEQTALAPITDNDDAADSILAAELNEGFIKRRQRFKDQQTVELSGRIHSDIFNINKYLLNNVNVSLELFKNDPKVYLMGKEADGFKLEIESAHLKVRRVTIAPSVMLAHAMVLEKTTAKYPLKRAIVHGFPYDFLSNRFEKSLHVGVMPSRVLVGLLNTTSVSGTFASNPFNFKHFKIKSIMLKAASASLPYSTELTFDFDKAKYLEAYNALFSNIKGSENNITYKDFAGGNTIFAFDLTPDLCNSGHYNLMKNGSLNLSIRLEEGASESITIMTYMEFDNIIEIDNKRNIFLDYSL